VIGDLMLAVEDGWAQADVADQARSVYADLGWVLHPDHVGHGYASEAVRELLWLSFADTASWCLMERVGMRRETYAVTESLHRSGEWLDTLGHALLAEEWSTDAARG
jgi:RimJ/RimL family protein N-acetyltransferase